MTRSNTELFETQFKRILLIELAKSLIENWYFEVSFAKSFLKHILGKPLVIDDLEDLDDSLK